MGALNLSREIATIITDLDKERERVALAVDNFAFERRKGAERIAEITKRPLAEVLEELPTVPRPRAVKEPDLIPAMKWIEGPKLTQVENSAAPYPFCTQDECAVAGRCLRDPVCND